MKTLPDNQQLIHSYLEHKLNPDEQLVLEARRLTDSEFAAQLETSLQTLHVVRAYGRKQLRQELQLVHKELMTPSPANTFYRRIMALFG
ncbi:MAG: hypothetical protein WBB45_13355 [Cyclobacteriaceae bacterium]